MNSQMRFRGYAGLIVLVMTIAGVGCGLSTADVEAQIKHNLPLGSSKQEVIKFLDAHGYEHSGGYKEALYYVKSRRLYASIDARSYSIFAAGKISVVFEFDRKDRLKSYKVSETFTGL